MRHPNKRVAVIGGGITGLAAAYRLQGPPSGLDVHLFEGGATAGGVLRTEHQAGLLIEHSADMFTTRDPWALDLCRQIGFDQQLINTNEQHRRAFVVRSGNLIPVPEGFALMSPAKMSSVLTTKLLSPRGKLRLVSEALVRRRKSNEDESLRDFAERRFGREAFERLIQPLVGGIYTADPTKLSMQAALPQFVKMEKEHGSLIRAAGKSAIKKANDAKSSGARYGQFVAPREGMGSLIAALVEKLDRSRLHLNSRVSALHRMDQQWQVVAGERSELFDAIVMALPAHQAAPLLQDVDAELSALLSQIEYASAAVVPLAFEHSQVRQMAHGFGFVVPAAENRRILAGSFSSIKFGHRAPDNQLLARVFIGGALQPELLEREDDELIRLAVEELRQLLHINGDARFAKVIRWRNAMPQYHLGHVERVARIRACESRVDGLVLAGNAYRGVGIPMCIASAEDAADELLKDLASNEI